jgi:ribonuclease J
LIEIGQVNQLPREKVILLVTGTQGEPRSALARMAIDQHKELKVHPGDRVVLSSRFIPGNERAIFSIVNHLYRRGAEVFTNKGSDIHVSGHAYREDLRNMLETVRPRYFVPIHGEYRHLVEHVQLAQETGMPKENTILLEDGLGIEMVDGAVKRLLPIELSRAVVDGRELGDIGSSVLRDRRQLAETGMVVVVAILDAHSGELVRGPELFAKGVAFEETSESLMAEVKEIVRDTLEDFGPEARTENLAVQEEIRLAVRRFFKNELDRKPVVIPIVLEV